MPRFKKPDWFEMLDNYDQIRFYLRKWAEGCYPCMLMVGPPGRGKSKLAQIATQGKAHLIKCHGKPFSTYVEAQQYCATHPHDPKNGQYQNIILDDVDGLYADSDGQRLVKAFGESDRPVVVPWPTIAAGRAAVPKSFVFEGSILIIDNAWGVSEHLEAIEDRSRAFYVEPPAVEIHRYVGEWFLQTGMHDMIYKFIGDHLPLIAPLVSTRLYGHALNAEKAGEDWQEFLLKRAEVRVVGEDGEETVHRIKKEMLEAIRFELDPYWKGKPVEDKIEAWMQRTNMSRKTWYNYMKAYYWADTLVFRSERRGFAAISAVSAGNHSGNQACRPTMPPSAVPCHSRMAYTITQLLLCNCVGYSVEPSWGLEQTRPAEDYRTEEKYTPWEDFYFENIVGKPVALVRP